MLAVKRFLFDHVEELLIDIVLLAFLNRVVNASQVVLLVLLDGNVANLVASFPGEIFEVLPGNGNLALLPLQVHLHIRVEARHFHDGVVMTIQSVEESEDGVALLCLLVDEDGVFVQVVYFDAGLENHTHRLDFIVVAPLSFLPHSRDVVVYVLGDEGLVKVLLGLDVVHRLLSNEIMFLLMSK